MISRALEMPGGIEASWGMPCGTLMFRLSSRRAWASVRFHEPMTARNSGCGAPAVRARRVRPHSSHVSGSGWAARMS